MIEQSQFMSLRAARDRLAQIGLAEAMIVRWFGWGASHGDFGSSGIPTVQTEKGKGPTLPRLEMGSTTWRAVAKFLPPFEWQDPATKIEASSTVDEFAAQIEHKPDDGEPDVSVRVQVLWKRNYVVVELRSGKPDFHLQTWHHVAIDRASFEIWIDWLRSRLLSTDPVSETALREWIRARTAAQGKPGPCRDAWNDAVREFGKSQLSGQPWFERIFADETGHRGRGRPRKVSPA